MEFEEELNTIRKRICQVKDKTEESTKNTLILPMLIALGYDVFDQLEVCSEYTADFGVKTKEKVDYAILKDGNPIILIECKSASTKLNNNHGSQLFRYFTATSAKIAILTNGIEYRFFSDFDEQNKMDKKPFLELDIENMTSHQIEELKKFEKDTLDLDKLLPFAKGLQALQAVKAAIQSEMENPSEEFVKLIASRCYEGTRTQKVIEQYSAFVKKGFTQIISDKARSAFDSAVELIDDKEGTEQTSGPKDKIETTQEEITGFHIVQAIGAQVTTVDRIVIRDAETYCAVLFDDNNRKPIIRLWFNSNKKYITLFDADKKDQKIPVNEVSDIYQYQDKICETIKRYI